MTTYTEPQVSFLVLDFQKLEVTRQCLESIRRHVKFPTKVIYCHNGLADYPVDFLREGLVDELIMPRTNGGLGLGTRALFAACHSPYAVYWQNDQIMGRDFEQPEVDDLIRYADHPLVGSISLAGATCGEDIYSERAHFIKTALYKAIEETYPLSPGGAGPYHDQPWREGQMQDHYRRCMLHHLTKWPRMAIDNGRTAERQNPDGSRWCHEPDTKKLWHLSGAIRERFVYPKFSDAEWEFVLANQTWPPGQIPENEVKDSFCVPSWH